MGQGPLSAFNTRKLASSSLAPQWLDATSKISLTTGGGIFSSLNLSAAALIYAGAARLSKIIIIAPGSTSGAFSINDAATLGGAAASNLVWTLPYNGTANVAGTVFTLDWPLASGLVLSAVPGAGSPIVALSYTY